MTYLLGTHNFTSFCGNLDDIDKVRTIYQADLIDEDGELTFIFVGNGFLRYMIRIMVGTLIQIGEGKKNPKILRQLSRPKIENWQVILLSRKGCICNELIIQKRC